MVARNEGLTKTYNRFHNPAERAPDIVRLRELHDAMDQAVLRAYGWDDLADSAAPEFLTEETEPTTATKAACSGPRRSATKCSPACSPSTPSAPPKNAPRPRSRRARSRGLEAA